MAVLGILIGVPIALFLLILFSTNDRHLGR